MARKSLKPQLNQIRAWVRQGRTDAWIAHQLEVSASQLKDFRKRHGLDAEGEDPAADIDLRDEIEAEIEAELDAADDEPDEDGDGHDPLFDGVRPDLAQLRAALVHAPALVQSFFRLHRAYQAASDRLLSLVAQHVPGGAIRIG